MEDQKDELEKQCDDQLVTKLGWDKKIYMFTKEELSKIKMAETNLAIATIGANQVVTDVVGQANHRIGEIMSAATKFIYSSKKGTLTVYIPPDPNKTPKK